MRVLADGAQAWMRSGRLRWERSGGAPWSAWGEGAIVSEDTVRGLAVRWLLLPANLSRLRERNARWLVACAVGISAMCGAAGVSGVLRLAPR